MTWFFRKSRGSLDGGTARMSDPHARVEHLEPRRLMAGDFRLIDAALSADKTSVTVHYSATGDLGFPSDTSISVEDNTSPSWIFPSTPGGPSENPDAAGQGSIFIDGTPGDFTMAVPLISAYRPQAGHSLLVVIDRSNDVAETDESNNVLVLIAAPPVTQKVDFRLQGLPAGFNGTTSQIDFEFKVTPSTDSEPFDVGLYYSANKGLDASDVLVATKSFNSAGTAGVQHGSFFLPGPIVADINRPYILVVADPLNTIAETNERNNVSVIPLPVVKVKVSGGSTIGGLPTFDLMKKARLFPMLNLPLPPGMRISSYSIDQRRATDTQWNTVAAIVHAAPPVLAQRLAGDIEYRATVTINGVDYTTLDGLETHVDVRFPSVHTIVKANNVVPPADAFIDLTPTTFHHFSTQLWKETQSPRTQEARWVVLDTATGLYSFIGSVHEDVSLTDKQEALLNLGPVPSDVFASDGLSAMYVVAEFRRHSSSRAVDPAAGPRMAGPRADEIELAGSGIHAGDRPLIVLDYIGHPVHKVHQIDPRAPAGAPTTLWTTLFDRRGF